MGRWPNRAPRIYGRPTTSAPAGTRYSFIPAASDPDVADTLTFSIEALPAWAMFDPASGRIHGMPGISDIGTTSSIVITVHDDDNASDSLAFSIHVQSEPTRSTLLTWEPPTHNTDGLPLTDLAGYRIYYWSTSPDLYLKFITLGDAGLTSYPVASLTADTYFFSITALNSAGVESEFSNVASITLQ